MELKQRQVFVHNSLVDELMRKLEQPTRAALTGALTRNVRNTLTT